MSVDAVMEHLNSQKTKKPHLAPSCGNDTEDWRLFAKTFIRNSRAEVLRHAKKKSGNLKCLAKGIHINNNNSLQTYISGILQVKKKKGHFKCTNPIRNMNEFAIF